MFQSYVSDICQQVDPKNTLIHHENLYKDMNVLTLVKKKTSFFGTDYEVMDITLGDLISKFADFSDFTETTVIRDYTHSAQRLVSAGIEGNVKAVGGGVKGGAESQREASSVTIKSKTVELRKLKNNYCGESINTNFMPILRDKEVLAFVDRIIFNAADVVLEEKTGVDGSCEASGGIKSAFLAFLKIFLQGKKSDATSFIVPAGKAYAYTINELTFKELTVEFTNQSLITGGDGEELQPTTPPAKSTEWLLLAPKTFETDNPPENYYETLQQVKEELQRMEALLQPLSCLPMATRSPLAQRLCDLSKDRDALTQLKKALDLWCEGEPFDQPQSESVRTLLDELRVATDTGMTNLLKAVYLLVSAMDKLPDGMPFIIGTCSPDILRCVNQLVSSIKEYCQADLPVSLPGPLQEGGELHWLTMFLCTTDDKLKELGIMAGQRPGVLLLVLCVTVQGLSMMRA